MAAYAAHLTRTATGEPNLFTLSAQDALANTVKPALRKLLEYSCAVRPGSTDWLLRWYDEFCLILDALLQHHYLQHYAASFSESFYGLWRVAAGGVGAGEEFSDGRRLPVRLERASLVLLVLQPYLRDRAHHYAERWRNQIQDGLLEKGATGALKRAFVHVHSVLHTLMELAKLVQLCRFVSGRTGSHAPALALLRLRLANAPPPSHDAPSTWRELITSLAAGRLCGGGALATLGGLALRGVELGAFLVQFLKWWEARGGGHAASLPAPPPPAPAPASAREPNKCAICLQPWRTPAALPVSGYIFCYSCICRHLASHGVCPVTRLPASPHSLVRLYLDV